MKAQHLHSTHSKTTASILKNTCTAFFLFAATAALICGAPSPRAEAAGPPPSLHVSGNQLVDDSGNAVYLKGANLPGLESGLVPNNIEASAMALVSPPWNARLIRLPICQDYWEANRWYGDDGTAQQNYRQAVYNVVSIASNANAYVIIDMHRSDMGNWGQNIAQHNMPDYNTQIAWQDISTDSNLAYNQAVFFGLYEEPHDAGPTVDASWDNWLLGGQQVSEYFNNQNYYYYTPGINGLITTVRQQDQNGNRASDNVLVIDGLNYAYDLTRVNDGTHVPQDPGGRGIIYDAHIYPFSGNMQKPADASPESQGIWESYVTVKNAPVFIGEYGTTIYDESQDGADFVDGLQKWAGAKAYGGGFCGTAAWAFWSFLNSGGAMTTDDTTHNPTQYEGTTVLNYLNN